MTEFDSPVGEDGQLHDSYRALVEGRRTQWSLAGYDFNPDLDYVPTWMRERLEQGAEGFPSYDEVREVIDGFPVMRPNPEPYRFEEHTPVTTHCEADLEGATPDILDTIDNARGCQRCGRPLGASPSDDFCSPECLRAWHARNTVALDPGSTAVVHVEPRPEGWQPTSWRQLRARLWNRITGERQ